ncbi:response regulator [Iamia majanohamensis]|uniref:Response regulator n=1 Tax=Iamia majanohamensis TaxID=467976 RepID=A0AAE9YD44_9ACTN|nr:response regulator [Iamia majanohamensis]WCO66602.1 response regulator [Iamia majanohamensis]
MPAARTVLLATDADWIADDVDAALADDDTEIVRTRVGSDVLDLTHELAPDLIVLDLQIGNMGGMAACMALRLEEGAGRLEPVPVLMMLDRPHDRFLARRSAADGWITKPLDPFRLRRAATALLDGGEWHDGVDPSLDAVTP